MVPKSYDEFHAQVTVFQMVHAADHGVGPTVLKLGSLAANALGSGSQFQLGTDLWRRWMLGGPSGFNGGAFGWLTIRYVEDDAFAFSVK